MSIGIAILSGYICLSTHATAVPLGAGAPPALSVIFHPSTKSLTLSAALTKSSLGMNSYSNFMPSFLLLVEGESETRAALVPPGRAAAPRARPSPEAHRVTSRAGADAHGSDRAVEHGLCA